jgi:hypothetical protein
VKKQQLEVQEIRSYHSKHNSDKNNEISQAIIARR